MQVGIDASNEIAEVEAGAPFATFVTPRDDIGSLVFWPVVSDFLITAVRTETQASAFSIIPEHTGNGFDAYADPPRILVVRQALTVRQGCPFMCTLLHGECSCTWQHQRRHALVAMRLKRAWVA